MSKMEPLSLRTSHAACTFLFPNKLNSLHKLSTRFWTLDVDLSLTSKSVMWIIFEVRRYLLLYFPLQAQTSGDDSVCSPTSAMFGSLPLGLSCPAA